ncbi:MAG: hypothetical protein O7E56_11505 [SAR324 cluster bacterium]|nr:hypothetical protein [SAR324 cluster bacterium]
MTDLQRIRDMEMTWWLEQAEGFRGRIDRREQFKWFVPMKNSPLPFPPVSSSAPSLMFWASMTP